MTPRVSVVVPLFNKASTLRRSLDSIARQTLGDFELIVVDDGSTDAGAALAEAYADNRLRLIRQPNAGPGAARNRGIAEARADLIAFLDADDEWLPEFLARSVALLDDQPDMVAVVSGYLEGPAARSTQTYWERRGLVRGPFAVRAGGSATGVVAVLAYMNPWATVARRMVVERHGGFYEAGCRYGEDNYLWLKVVFNERVFIETAPLVHWHSESSGLSKNLRRARPVEPFLTAPEPLVAACPVPLRPLLHDVLAIRAAKTASMLSFWGDWRAGRALVSRFCSPRDVRYRWVAIGQAAATPLGALAGAALRMAAAAAPRLRTGGSASLDRA